MVRRNGGGIQHHAHRGQIADIRRGGDHPNAVRVLRLSGVNGQLFRQILRADGLHLVDHRAVRVLLRPRGEIRRPGDQRIQLFVGHRGLHVRQFLRQFRVLLFLQARLGNGHKQHAARGVRHIFSKNRVERAAFNVFAQLVKDLVFRLIGGHVAVVRPARCHILRESQSAAGIAVAQLHAETPILADRRQRFLVRAVFKQFRDGFIDNRLELVPVALLCAQHLENQRRVFAQVAVQQRRAHLSGGRRSFVFFTSGELSMFSTSARFSITASSSAVMPSSANA